ncbi:MAG: tetratricopeptide repeat protein [Rikenellaceae bacterium]|nr:tetratricopeptide repeat protein [Rikenellaceae bacterium]MCL2692849.1 tetratricopeptide repeat protein [Rikenellaceae bacterium]
MKFIRMTVAAVATMLVVAGANINAQDFETSRDAYNAAVEKARANNFVDAIPLFERVLEMEGATSGDAPLSELALEVRRMLPQVYLRAGAGFARTNEFDKAAQYLTRAIEQAEISEDVRTMSQAREMIAQVYRAMGASAFNNRDFAAAAEIFQRGYDLNPGDPQLAMFLAQSYAEMGEYDRSFEIFRGIIALEEHGEKYKANVEEARTRMAQYVLRNANAIASSQPARAIEILAESVTVNPDPTAYMLLLQTANNSRNWDKVIEFGQRAAEAQTDAALRSTANFLLANAYDNKGDRTRALELYRRVTAGPNAAAARTQIAAIEAGQ